MKKGDSMLDNITTILVDEQTKKTLAPLQESLEKLDLIESMFDAVQELKADIDILKNAMQDESKKIDVQVLNTIVSKVVKTEVDICLYSFVNNLSAVLNELKDDWLKDSEHGRKLQNG